MIPFMRYGSGAERLRHEHIGIAVNSPRGGVAIFFFFSTAPWSEGKNLRRRLVPVPNRKKGIMISFSICYVPGFSCIYGAAVVTEGEGCGGCLLYTSPSPRDDY